MRPDFEQDIKPDLIFALQQLKAEYNSGPTAIRTGKVIKPIHGFCSKTLNRFEIQERYLTPGVTDGSYLNPRTNDLLNFLVDAISKRASVTSASKVRSSLSRSYARIRNQAKRQYKDAHPAIEAIFQQLESDLSANNCVKSAEEVRQDILGLLSKERERRKRQKHTISGAYIQKEIDVCVAKEDSGPLLAISVKSILSSFSNNATNRFEEFVGDATNLHTRYPMLSLGFILIIPVITDVSRCGLIFSDPSSASTTFHRDGSRLVPSDIIQRFERMIMAAQPRDSVHALPGSYESACLIAVDFSGPVPSILPTFPRPGSGVRVENFFHKLVESYIERNPEMAPSPYGFHEQDEEILADIRFE